MEKGAPGGEKLWGAVGSALKARFLPQRVDLGLWTATEFLCDEDPQVVSAQVNAQRLDFQMMPKSDFYRDRDTFTITFRYSPDLTLLRAKLQWRWFVPMHATVIRFASSLGVEEVVKTLGSLDADRNISTLRHQGRQWDLGAGDHLVTLQGFPDSCSAESVRDLVAEIVGTHGGGIRVGFIGSGWAAVVKVDQEMLQVVTSTQLFVQSQDFPLLVTKGATPLMRPEGRQEGGESLADVLRDTAHSSTANAYRGGRGDMEGHEWERASVVPQRDEDPSAEVGVREDVREGGTSDVEGPKRAKPAKAQPSHPPGR